jgi:hypothetical protein
MSDVKVEHKVVLTRHEAARWISGLGEALSGDGPVSIHLADTTVELEVPTTSGSRPRWRSTGTRSSSSSSSS